jgi:hypothetical protein
MHEEHTDFRTTISTYMPEFLDIIDRAKTENTVTHLELENVTSSGPAVLLYVCTLYAREQDVNLSISHRRYVVD